MTPPLPREEERGEENGWRAMEMGDDNKIRNKTGWLVRDRRGQSKKDARNMEAKDWRGNARS